MCYCYIKSERGLWTVGFYDQRGKWYPDSDWDDREKAAARVHYLNGGRNCERPDADEADLPSLKRQ